MYQPTIVSATARNHNSPVPLVDPGIGVVTRQLAPITLKELQAADSTLMDRVDTKFVLTTAQLAAVLTNVTDAYRVLTIDGICLQHYHTCYLDTADLLFYRQHHNGYRNRYKVRLRTYLDSRLAFLEVKRKNNKDRTIKSRLKLEELPPGEAVQVTAAMQAFLQPRIPVTPVSLSPQLTNTFTRLTLVNRFSPERVTIDFDLCFGERHQRLHYPHLVIAEVKQPHYSCQSPFVQTLRAQHAYQMGFSKYCIGIALRRPEIKQNWFKPTLLRMAQFH